jgi:excisionase family DNA binding protein
VSAAPRFDPRGDLDPWLSTNTVAAMFEVQPETVRDWIALERIPATKINGKWRIKKSDMLAFANSQHGDDE